MSCYYLGFIGNLGLIEKFLKIKPEDFSKVKKWLNKYGSSAAFFTWLPVIGDPLAVALGLIRSNVFFVSIFMLLGKLLRYLALAYLTDLGVNAVTG
jgi:membrane protein YqaA with SNARE-associated domain